MSGAQALAMAITFVWLGMVSAISFIEAPLKFRAPGITIPLGLGIGRLVFRALNAVEAVWAVVLIAAVAVGSFTDTGIVIAVAVAVAALAAQILGVRPALTKRSDAVLAGGDHSHRSHAHFVYVGFEIVKVAALITLGTLLLQT
ncbi:hypothetical protein GII30_09160 [Gordonia amarae]|uniref:DUF4149 domain-containing protein n=2 Tax=Gordonia amarae TaxID=36821 RepID=G7GMU8_9ACTN|nr:hypothetical protein [Gordonia amarae]MCS3878549.1 hypothetical protein [Gordonia amarae]QHN17157.1 hypothetical protein GII35_09385 [Gordonia amarae]QHN21683.1 hypothetical protein GII34_09165 [Gordonia amarae]QHN30535.1 hypothetical protein GII32_09175 [Gordonia amarae]QHN39311.1 hypothetical protein GII30_09160 [Gordonia amarae]